MHDLILPSPSQQPQPEDERGNASDAEWRAILEIREYSHQDLMELAEDLGYRFGHDAPVLRPEHKQALLNRCLTGLGYEGFDTEIPTEANEPNDEKMTQEEVDALGIQVDYDGSRLTPEQRRALTKSYWALHLRMINLRSPQYYAQYYGPMSQCLSVSDAAWPGLVTYLEAENMKRVFFEPKDLIERLQKLKPSDNFELRKFRHPPMSWQRPTPLDEKGFEIFPSNPEWLLKQLFGLDDMEKRKLGNRRFYGKLNASEQQLRKSVAQYAQHINDRWNKVESSAQTTPLPDLHLLRNMGESPGGTLFPWYLVKGLMALREHANAQGREVYDGEYEVAAIKRTDVINRWTERNPDSILADDPMSIYKTWPADLMDELNHIEWEAIRCGRRKYVDLLREAETKMQTLVAFWRNSGLVTGQRTPPLCWWQDPKVKMKQLPKPQYLQERLVAIGKEFSHFDTASKLRICEWSRWMESMISGDSEPAISYTPIPPSLQDELDIVWQGHDWVNHDEMEDEMIDGVRRWRKSKHQRCGEERLHTKQLGSDTGPAQPFRAAGSPVCSDPVTGIQGSVSGSVIELKETLQLKQKLSKGARRRYRMSPMVEDRAICGGRLQSKMKNESRKSWQHRLRRGPDAVSASRDGTKATNTQTGKPRGIVKRRKASIKRRS